MHCIEVPVREASDYLRLCVALDARCRNVLGPPDSTFRMFATCLVQLKAQKLIAKYTKRTLVAYKLATDLITPEASQDGPGTTWFRTPGPLI
eukprot:6194425-Pleurochrysis_carterae.AAC.1